MNQVQMVWDAVKNVGAKLRVGSHLIGMVGGEGLGLGLYRFITVGVCLV